MNDPQIMTVKEVADYLRVHPITVYRLLRQRQLPAFKSEPTIDSKSTKSKHG
jgi:hypothetical protein